MGRHVWLFLFVALLPDACVHGQARHKAPVLVSIGSLSEAGSGQASERVLLRGAITHAQDPTVLQDQTGAVELHTAHTAAFSLGDEVEVTALRPVQFPAPIQAIQLQTLWHSSLPLPLAITPDIAADGRYNLHYVQTIGLLTHIEEHNGNTVLSLQGDHQFFSARLERGTAIGAEASTLEQLELGSTLRLNGILLTLPGQYSDAGSFVILLTFPNALGIVHGPSWWTVRHTIHVFGVFVLLGLSLQVLHLRQVKRRYTAVLAERARIARDIHDTLAQGFAGLALQLEVVRSKVQKDHAAAGHLELALRMVQHSRAEAHRSIAALRAFSYALPLQSMLEEMVQQLQNVPHQRVELAFAGSEDVKLPPHIAENTYKIVQELMSNAQQHARASRIRTEVRVLTDCLHVLVEDDGVGMDPQLLQVAPPGHFGLLGLRERVQTMKGTVRALPAERGTALLVQIPIPGRRFVRPRSRTYDHVSLASKEVGAEHG